MGRSYVSKVPPLAVATFALLTVSSALLVTSTILPSSRSFRWAFSSFTRTISPTERLRSRFCHFDWLWRFSRCCRRHLIQNWLAKYWALLHQLHAYRSCWTKWPCRGMRGRVFIVSSIVGVRRCGSSVSEGMVSMGQLFTIPVTSTSIASSIWRTVLIWHSHTPLKWEACGGLKVHSHPCSAVNFWIWVWSISRSASCNWDFPPTKLVPWSHLSFITGLWRAKKQRTAQMNELASMVSNILMWMARLLRQVKMRPHRLALTEPPQVFL